MIRSANIATYPARLGSLRKMMESIYDQFDVIRIYFNEYEKSPPMPDPEKKIMKITGENLTDNGKFIGLDMVKDHEYFFTMDDDLIYPPDYVQRSVENIDKYGMIICYHGRQLLSKGGAYYSSHKAFHCLNHVHSNLLIDVCGSGVSAWSTKYFHPTGLADHPLHLMSDLIISHCAAKRGKKIGVMEHEAGWIKHIDNESSIFETESKTDQTNQIMLADKIYTLNHG